MQTLRSRRLLLLTSSSFKPRLALSIHFFFILWAVSFNPLLSFFQSTSSSFNPLLLHLMSRFFQSTSFFLSIHFFFFQSTSSSSYEQFLSIHFFLSFNPLLLHLMSSFFPPTARLHEISGHRLRSHLLVSSAHPLQWWGRWNGHWMTTRSTVCSSAPHSQAAERATPHLYKQERKRPTLVRRRSRTHAVLVGAIPGEWVPMSGMKVRSLAI